MIQLQAILDGYTPRKDGGMSLRFVSQDITPELKFLIMEAYQHFGWIVFKEKELQESDIPKADPDDTSKTPSQRLRSVLFVLWKQGNQLDSFENFYRQMMEKFIDHVKSKLTEGI